MKKIGQILVAVSVGIPITLVFIFLVLTIINFILLIWGYGHAAGGGLLGGLLEDLVDNHPVVEKIIWSIFPFCILTAGTGGVIILFSSSFWKKCKKT